MTQPPDYRRRRAAVGALALLMLVIAQRETPVLGSVSLSIGDGHAPRVAAELAPHLATIATGLAEVGALLTR